MGHPGCLRPDRGADDGRSLPGRDVTDVIRVKTPRGETAPDPPGEGAITCALKCDQGRCDCGRAQSHAGLLAPQTSQREKPGAQPGEWPLAAGKGGGMDSPRTHRRSRLCPPPGPQIHEGKCAV